MSLITLARQRTTIALLLLLACLMACGADPVEPTRDMADSAPDLGAMDMPTDDAPDTSPPDQPADQDEAPDAPDAPLDMHDMPDDSPDAIVDMDPQPEVPLPGFGAISGECGVLTQADWLSEGPSFYINALDLDTRYDEALHLMDLTPESQEMIRDGNAGGNSLLSEVFALEILVRCELGALLKTETEIIYQNPRGKITDILMQLDGFKIGVSVMRAVAFPFDQPYPASEATRILTDKLEGIAASSLNVAPEDQWEKQLLHIIAYAPEHVPTLQAAYQALDDELKGDTVILVTVTNGDDCVIYNSCPRR